MKLQEEIAAMLNDGSQRHVDMKARESIRTIRKEAKDARAKGGKARPADG